MEQKELSEEVQGNLEFSMEELNTILVSLQTNRYTFSEFEQSVRPLIYKIYSYANQGDSQDD